MNPPKQAFQLGDYIVTTKLLGKGSYGEVYLGYTESKQKLAIKTLSSTNSNPIKIMKNQVQLLQKVQSPHIVKLYDVKKNKDGDYFIVLEYCSGDLKKEIEKRFSNGDYIEQKQVINILRQICSGYKILYQNKIIHRDLKPQNVLSLNNVYKLADFGFGRFVNDPNQMSKKTWLGSPIYTSPQILKQLPYSSKCDIWSLGVMLYQLLYYKYPFKVETVQGLREAIGGSKKVVIPKEPVRSEGMKKLLAGMLEIEEWSRMYWSEVFCNQMLSQSKNLGMQVEQSTQVLLQLLPIRQVLTYYSNICLYLTRLQQNLSSFSCLLTPSSYLLSLFCLSRYTLYICKSVSQHFLSNRFPHERITEEGWAEFKEREQYWKYLREFNVNQRAHEEFLKGLEGNIGYEVKGMEQGQGRRMLERYMMGKGKQNKNQNRDKMSPSKLTTSQSPKQTFDYNEYALIMAELIEEMKRDRDSIPHFIIDWMETARNPMICFNVETNWEEVHERVEREIRDRC